MISNLTKQVYYKDYHGDCSATFLVGNVDEEGRRLVKVTEECLYKAISLCGPDVPFSEIGNVIEAHALKNELNVVPDFVGHGIGSYFHGPPQVCHYGILKFGPRGRRNRVHKHSFLVANDEKGTMKPGMTFTIEPILSLGSPRFTILRDKWTAVTADNSRTAQFEHTVLIRRDGCEVLTIAPEFK